MRSIEAMGRSPHPLVRVAAGGAVHSARETRSRPASSADAKIRADAGQRRRCLRALRGPGRRPTTRTSRWGCSSPGRSAATSTRSTPSPGSPTTSRTSRSTRACGRRSSISGRRSSTPPTAGEAEGPVFVALGETVRAPGRPEGAAPRPAVGLPAGHGEEPLRELGGAPRLLPALGQPGGPAGAPRLRAGRPRAPAALRRDLHRARSSPTTGRTRPSTTPATASTCPRT